MADTITQLQEGDIFLVKRGDKIHKVSSDTVKEKVVSQITIGAVINGATANISPIDND